MPSSPPPQTTTSASDAGPAAENWRSFSSDVEETARAWRVEITTTRSWTVVGSTQASEAKALEVRSDNGLGGYAKPGRSTPPVAQHPRAAHEKICADLAFELGLPVPPVVLWVRAGIPKEQENYACISLQAFAPPYTWAQVLRLPGIATRILPDLSRAASAMAVFDTWVDNCDRAGRLPNLLAKRDGGATPVVRVAYIDYANALSFAWCHRKWDSTTVVKCYPPEVTVDLRIMSTALARVESLPNDVIKNIVERIPPQFLTKEKQKLVVDGLLGRKTLIRSMLKTKYEGLQ